MDTLKDVQVLGIKAQGQKELTRYMRGERLTAKQAILGKCYDCMGGYGDGKGDCSIPGCTLYQFMPYRANKEAKPKKERTEKQMDSAARLTLIRSVARRKAGL